MDVFMKTKGLWHISEQIFGLLSDEDLDNCCDVCEDWRQFLTRENGVWQKRRNDILQNLDMNLSKKKVGRFDGKSLLEHEPNWQNVANYFKAKETLHELSTFANELDSLLSVDPDNPGLISHGFISHKPFVFDIIESNRINFTKILIGSPVKWSNEDPRVLNSWGRGVIRNALHKACFSRKPDILRLLLNNMDKLDIDYTRKNIQRQTFFEEILASRQVMEKMDLIDVILENSLRIEQFAQTNVVEIILFNFVHFEHKLESYESLLQKGISKGFDINSVTRKGKTLFEHICEFGRNTQIATFFLISHKDIGFDITKKTSYGSNVLHIISKYPNLDILKVALDKNNETKLDVNKLDGSGNTILHNLVSNCHGERKLEALSCLKYVLNNAVTLGIDLNVKGTSGFTSERTAFQQMCFSDPSIELIDLWIDTPSILSSDTFGNAFDYDRNFIFKFTFTLYNAKKAINQDMTEVDKMFRKDGKRSFDRDVLVKICCFLYNERKEELSQPKLKQTKEN